jgi:predicted transcriptional regulator
MNTPTITEKQLSFIEKLVEERKDLDDPYIDVVKSLIENNSLPNLPRMLASNLIETLLNIKVPRITTTSVAPTALQISIPEGTYTIVLNGDVNDYVTLRVEREYFTGENKLIVTYLAGSDNEISYRGFAFVNGNGIAVWSKFKSESRIVEAAKILWAIAQTEAGLGEAHEEFLKKAEAYALTSGRCCRCNRPLTVPTSLHRGLGPDCAARENI